MYQKKKKPTVRSYIVSPSPPGYLSVFRSDLGAHITPKPNLRHPCQDFSPPVLTVTAVLLFQKPRADSLKRFLNLAITPVWSAMSVHILLCPCFANGLLGLGYTSSWGLTSRRRTSSRKQAIIWG